MKCFSWNILKFHDFLKIFHHSFFKYFIKLLFFVIKWLKTFKYTITIYKASRKYIMLFMDNSRHLSLTGLLTDWSHCYRPFTGIICSSAYSFSSISFCFSYSYVRRTKLASSLVNVCAHETIAMDSLIIVLRYSPYLLKKCLVKFKKIF